MAAVTICNHFGDIQKIKSSEASGTLLPLFYPQIYNKILLECSVLCHLK